MIRFFIAYIVCSAIFGLYIFSEFLVSDHGAVFPELSPFFIVVAIGTVFAAMLLLLFLKRK